MPNLPEHIEELKTKWAKGLDCSYSEAKKDIDLLCEELSKVEDAWRYREEQVFDMERDLCRATNLLSLLHRTSPASADYDNARSRVEAFLSGLVSGG